MLRKTDFLSKYKMTKNKSVSSLFAKYTLSIVEKASRSVRLFLWNRAFPSLKANYIGQGCRLSISMGASVSSKGGLAFSNCGSIVAKRGILALGKNAFIGVGVQIVCRQSIKIGDDCLFAEYVTIRDHDHVFDSGCRGAGCDERDSIELLKAVQCAASVSGGED